MYQDVRKYKIKDESNLTAAALLNETNEEKEPSFPSRSQRYAEKRNVSSRRSYGRPTDTSTPYKDTIGQKKSPFLKRFKDKIMGHLNSSSRSASSFSSKSYRDSSDEETHRYKRSKRPFDSSRNPSFLKGASPRKVERSRHSFSIGDKHTDVTSDFEKLSSKRDRRKPHPSELVHREYDESDESSSSGSISDSESSGEVKSSDSFEETPSKRRRTVNDLSRRSKHRSCDTEKFHLSDEEDFVHGQMDIHRNLVAKAAYKSYDAEGRMRVKTKTSSSSINDSRNPISRSRFSWSAASSSDVKRSDRKDHNHRRAFSERANSDLPSRSYVGGRKRLSDGHFLATSRDRRSSGNELLFPREFKSRFYENLDEYELNNARNALELETRTDVPYVDTHCHIDFLFKRLSFNKSMDEYMDQTFFKFPANFEGCIADWCQPSLYRQASSVLSANNSNFKLWGAFGCHPHFVNEYSDRVEKEIEHHISNYRNVIAWGEMGLDYSDRFGPTDHEKQKEVFAKQLCLACRHNLPLVIHCRDADQDLLKIMKKYVPSNTKIHRHCLTVEEREARPLLDHFPNCYVGFTNLLSNRSAYRPRDAVAKIPLDRIVLETDAPYFIPQCIMKKSRGAAKWSHPGMASSVACEIASIKDMDIDDVLLSIRDNVTRLYGI